MSVLKIAKWLAAAVLVSFAVYGVMGHDNVAQDDSVYWVVEASDPPVGALFGTIVVDGQPSLMKAEPPLRFSARTPRTAQMIHFIFVSKLSDGTMRGYCGPVRLFNNRKGPLREVRLESVIEVEEDLEMYCGYSSHD